MLALFVGRVDIMKSSSHLILFSMAIMSTIGASTDNPYPPKIESIIKAGREGSMTDNLNLAIR